METIASPRRRSLPPVPRPAAEQKSEAKPEPDATQAFVAGLRSAAAAFARAAGAQTAVVPEAVPPARHRRSRCRVVLRYADGHEADLTFLGPAAGRGGRLPRGFETDIQRWLGAGQPRNGAWLVTDMDTADGTAIDLPAWLATR